MVQYYAHCFYTPSDSCFSDKPCVLVHVSAVVKYFYLILFMQYLVTACIFTMPVFFLVM